VSLEYLEELRLATLGYFFDMVRGVLDKESIPHHVDCTFWSKPRVRLGDYKTNVIESLTKCSLYPVPRPEDYAGSIRDLYFNLSSVFVSSLTAALGNGRSTLDYCEGCMDENSHHRQLHDATYSSSTVKLGQDLTAHIERQRELMGLHMGEEDSEEDEYDNWDLQVQDEGMEEEGEADDAEAEEEDAEMREAKEEVGEEEAGEEEEAEEEE
jgi:hypothetical protein